jgi:hypothetical protein
METYKELEPKLKSQVDDVLDSLKHGEKGIYMKISRYPKRYLKDGVKRLWKYDIHSYRLIYTIVGTEESKIYLILDFLNHKEYDVLFGYHTS